MTAGPVLRDIHLPAEPSWWPPAPGWWVLAALVVLALAFAWRAWAARRHRAALQRALRDELATLRRENHSPAAQVAAMSMLLRRAAKRYTPAATALRDEPWLEFLDAGDETRPFSRGPGRLLLDGPYRPTVEAKDADALATLVDARLAGFVLPTRGNPLATSAPVVESPRANAGRNAGANTGTNADTRDTANAAAFTGNPGREPRP